ncbi:MAG TPA: VOC family protein [Steroidobacteraceae bacterium]
MSNAEIRGRFVWHELMTTDPDAAGTFYSNVVPWKTQPSGMPSYTLWMSGDNRVGGLMSLPHDADGKPPRWMVYIGTPDVDASVATAQRLGGRVLKGAAEIPNVGKFAVLSDPQGAAFIVFTPNAGSDGAASSAAVGDFTWHELATTDPHAALRFYSELFGWKKGASHDMGTMGTYQIISHEGQDVGGVYHARDASMPPSWLGYVRVTDAGKAASAVKAGGGRVLHGPAEVPGGSWIVMALDPQGGAFAVVETPTAQAAANATPPPKKSAKAAAPQARSTPALSSGRTGARKKTASANPTAGSKTGASGTGAKRAAKRVTTKRASANRSTAKRAAARRATGTTAKRVTARTRVAKRTVAKRTVAKSTVAKSTRAKRGSAAARRGNSAGRARAHNGRRGARSGGRKRR